MKKLFLLILIIFTACTPEFDEEKPVTIEVDHVASHHFWGDLWTTTWASDDNLYSIFGDGTGRSNCLPTVDFKIPGEGFEGWEVATKKDGCFEIEPFPEEAGEPCLTFDCEKCHKELCEMTPAGLVRLRGNPPNFTNCTGEEECLIARDLPYGNDEVLAGLDKPSSLLAIDDRLIAAMHWPPGETTEGYLAYSDDFGKTWTKVEGTPWKGRSNFKIMMFINMGQAYSLNEDGYVYAFGKANEIVKADIEEIFLARVVKEEILNYQAYEYLSNNDAENPEWTKDQDKAKALKPLQSIAQASGIYHPFIDRYLFLSGYHHFNSDPEPRGALYQSPTPWGPWEEVGNFFSGTQPSFIPKGLGPNYVYYTAAGGSHPYSLNIQKIEFVQ